MPDPAQNARSSLEANSLKIPQCGSSAQADMIFVGFDIASNPTLDIKFGRPSNVAIIAGSSATTAIAAHTHTRRFRY